MLGGVCGGLAESLGADPALLRVLLVALTLITGGAAAVVYLAAWALAPTTTARPSDPASRDAWACEPPMSAHGAWATRWSARRSVATRAETGAPRTPRRRGHPRCARTRGGTRPVDDELRVPPLSGRAVVRVDPRTQKSMPPMPPDGSPAGAACFSGLSAMTASVVRNSARSTRRSAAPSG